MLQGNGATALSNYIKGVILPQVTEIRSANIFDGELTDLQGFPAATVTMQDLQGKVLDNARNEHTFRFTIRIFIERTKQNFGISKAESILRSMANDLISIVDADPTLGNNCIIASPMQARMGYVDGAIKDIRLVEVTLDCIDANTWR